MALMDQPTDRHGCWPDSPWQPSATHSDDLDEVLARLSGWPSETPDTRCSSWPKGCERLMTSTPWRPMCARPSNDAVSSSMMRTSSAPWLDEDGIGYDPQSLAVALRQLEELGRIVRPVQEWSSVPRSPGVYVPPRIYNGP